MHTPSYSVSIRRIAALALAFSLPVITPVSATQAQAAPAIISIDLISGRSLPITGGDAISKVTVANPDVADVVVISENEVVINAIATGETDVILWGTGTPRRHYRVSVRSSPERRQILLGVKFAEVRKEALRNISTSLRARSTNGNTRVGGGAFNTDDPIDDEGNVSIGAARFLTVLSTFNTQELLGLLNAEEQRGNARFLAEPNLMAANLEEATFLAGGEFPIPFVQGGGGGGGNNQFVTIQFREFGIRLTFKGEVLTDSLLKLMVRPEVSSLDYGNAITLQGFQIPALRTRRVESTVDVLTNRSLIISGMFNEERERVKTGIPFLVNVPILGDLLSSQRWVNNESELIVVVTPILMDPNNPRSADLLRFVPDSALPARPALERRLPPPPGTP